MSTARLRVGAILALCALVSALLNLVAAPAAAGDPPYTPPAAGEALRFACGPDGTQASGARYRICMPTWVSWNRDLLVYAHGYVAPNKPVAIPEDQLRLPDGTSIPDVAGFLGYAFATTSYSINGLAVRQAQDDLVDLVHIFRAGHPTLRRVYLVGPSEGGLITTLEIEQRPDIFDGGLATCGPIGDFRRQIDHVADFRVVFDYFFPGLLPGTAISVPQSLMDGWETIYEEEIKPAIQAPANAISVTQILSVTQAAWDPGAPATSIPTTFETLLWYNVFGATDAQEKLGGQPFDNAGKVYAGSLDDAALNAGVQRYAADPLALAELAAHYETAGWPRAPLVTMHTTLDPIVPAWHQSLYRDKILANRRSFWHDQFLVSRYDHCNFTSNEVLVALTRLIERVQNPPSNRYMPVIRK